MFAEDYPRFMEISELTPNAERMNERYEALFATNRDIFDGARVLDLASHDGRYSFAALKTGAAHVTGVEVRQSLIDKAEETFAFYGQDPESYRFVCGDIFEVLARETFEVDVVLCLGYLYHTYRHTELMYRLHELTPKHLIVDTMVAPGTQPSLKVIRERDTEDIRSAAKDAWAVRQVLVARPTVPALQLLLDAYDFEIESMYDWPGKLADRPLIPGLAGYAKGKRVTVRCRSRLAAIEAGWGPVAPLRVPAPRRVRERRPAQDPPRSPPQSPAQSQPPKASAAHSGHSGGGWRERVNQTLARATGYELRRATTKR
jgi:SAM-dependent methyltransferase